MRVSRFRTFRSARVLLVACLVALTGSTAAIAGPSVGGGAAANRAVVSNWQDGIRAGTTTFSSKPGATCKPKVGTKESDRHCAMAFSGKFTATDRGYHGTYSGTATIGYPDPANSPYAAFEAGSVTYTIRDASNHLIGAYTLAIDLGTGGVSGYPYDLVIAYSIEERSFDANDLVLRMEGTGVNQLDGALNPVRTFIDRLAFQ